MTTITVSSGQTSVGLSLNFADALNVLAGGTALDTTVNSGGGVNDSGFTSDTRVNSSGVENVVSGGIALDTVVVAGGSQSILTDGVATSSTISSGGIQNIFATGSATIIGDDLIRTSTTTLVRGSDSPTVPRLARGVLSSPALV
jgi:autotransporter passenger strand-loop-strand repeat protein